MIGETPIAYSLMQAINNDFRNPNTLKHIVLITDGGEGCGGDPCRLIADLMRYRNDIKIDVIAIAGDENSSFMGLTCLPNSTGGKFVVVIPAREMPRRPPSLRRKSGLSPMAHHPPSKICCCLLLLFAVFEGK